MKNIFIVMLLALVPMPITVKNRIAIAKAIFLPIIDYSSPE